MEPKYLLLFFLVQSIKCQSEHPDLGPTPWGDYQVPVEENTTPDSRLQGRIFGSDLASIGEAPYHVSIRHDGRHRCSGAFVLGATAEHVVVTTATCVMPPAPSTEPYPARTLSVIAGRLRINERYGGEQQRQVRRVRYHRGLWRASHENDFAVLFLNESFTLTPSVYYVNLPVRGRPRSSSYIISGWGVVDNSSPPQVAEGLMKARVNYVQHTECYNKYWYTYGQWAVFNHSLCLLGEQNAGACVGDEGTPAVGVSRGDTYLAGIFQWKHGVCGDDWPSIFADMNTFGDWVDVVTTESNVTTIDGYGR